MSYTKLPSILVVDDDSSVRRVIAALLSGSGYVVRIAPNGNIALQMIEELLPDIVLSDLQMPGMSGFELLRLVCHRHPCVGLVAMSAKFSFDEPPLRADAFLPQEYCILVAAVSPHIHSPKQDDPTIATVKRPKSL